MSDIYKLQFANNTLTYPGWNGYVSWTYTKDYEEVLLWSGDTTANNVKLNLTQHPSAFDSIKIITYGVNAGNNTINPNPIYTDYAQLSAQNKQCVNNGMWGATATNGVTRGWWFFGTLTGCSGQQWTWTSAYGRNWNASTGGEARFDFTRVREIWGINYGI